MKSVAQVSRAIGVGREGATGHSLEVSFAIWNSSSRTFCLSSETRADWAGLPTTLRFATALGFGDGCGGC